MRILIIGDVHQTDFWKTAIQNKVDRVIFLGDYFDFHGTAPQTNPLENLKEIIEYKRANDNVDLLLGNHDMHYLDDQPCSSFQENLSEQIRELLLSNLDEFKMAVRYEDWVFSHAGFTKSWFSLSKDEDPLTKANEFLKNRNFSAFSFFEYDRSGYGESPYQGPTWVRPNSLIYDPFYNQQVVGHTTLDYDPIFFQHNNIKIGFVDTPDHNKPIIFDTENLPEFKQV